MKIVAFMNQPAGRIARVIVGLAMILWGLGVIGGLGGGVVAALGVLPLATGASGYCITRLFEHGAGAAH